MSDAPSLHQGADIIIRAGEWATVWVFEPVTERAREFIETHVELEDWQTMGDGGAFAVDHRPARELAHYLAREGGFRVLNPDYGWLRT